MVVDGGLELKCPSQICKLFFMYASSLVCLYHRVVHMPEAGDIRATPSQICKHFPTYASILGHMRRSSACMYEAETCEN